MTLTLNQDVLNSHNQVMGLKGHTVTLISDAHRPVLLVRNERDESFSVRETGTDYDQQKNKIK